MEPGYFVSFEGPEGSGKSTQIRLLAEQLRAAGRAVVTTREPGGTEIGERIRGILLDRSSTGMSAETEALLLNAARAQHVREVIDPALREGIIVLSDRFSDSTLAYQGGGRGLSISGLLELQRFAIGNLEPNLRILLDLDVEIGLRRRHSALGTANRLDEEDLRFHRAVRDTFVELAHCDPSTWVVIDANLPTAVVCDSVAQAVFGRLAAVGAPGRAPSISSSSR